MYTVPVRLSHTFRAILLSCPLFGSAGCVAYHAAPVELSAVAMEVEQRAVGRIDFAAAVAYARLHHHKLLSLAAEARAAGLDIRSTAVEARATSEMEQATLAADPLALTKLGPRGAAARLAVARRDEKLAEIREAEREFAARIAAAFALLRVLRQSQAPRIDVDPEAFRRAGLASKTDAGMLRAAVGEAQAEGQEIQALRSAHLAELRRLMGLGPDAELDLVLPEGEFPALPEATRERLLQRPDLAVALARYRRADAEFRLAIADQYPSLALGTDIRLDSGGIGGLVALKIPVGAAGPARAAGERREAARLDVEGALLAAQRETVERRAALAAAKARAGAAKASASAMAEALRATLVRLEVEPDAFAIVADFAERAVKDATRARQAALAAAKARIRYAEAYGWPLPGEVP